MRVITGSARGAKLAAAEGLELRPTADRVKEALFSSIQFAIEGRRVLDLFAGSGQLGIEVLSRGAKEAVFVDSGASAVAVIKKNLEHTKLAEKATVINEDYEACLRRNKKVFDIVFIDPPYGKGLAARSLGLVVPFLSQGGIVICETAQKDPMPSQSGSYKLIRSKEYGKTALHYYTE